MIPFEQTLYYWNVPGHEDHIGFFENHRSNGFFKNFSTTRPVFIFTGIREIKFKECGIDFSKLDEIDFYLYEPSTFYNIFTPDPSCDFYHEDLWEENDNLRSMELDTLSAMQAKFDLKINVYTSDYNINKYCGKLYQNLNLFCFDTFLRQIGTTGIYPDDLVKTKKFVTHNKRFALHRLITVGALQDKNANYTWPFKMECELKTHAWYEHDKLPQAHNIEVRPSRIDVRSDMEIDNLQRAGTAPHVKEFSPQSLVTSMSEACIAIVNETRFGQPTAYFSEKTFDPIRCMLPFILVAPPYTLEYLRKLGFTTWDCFWDESYDKIENHTKRMDAILKLIEHLDTWSLDDMRDMIRFSELVLFDNLKKVRTFTSNSSILCS